MSTDLEKAFKQIANRAFEIKLATIDAVVRDRVDSACMHFIDGIKNLRDAENRLIAIEAFGGIEDE